MDPTRTVARTEHLVFWSRLGRRFRIAELERLLWQDRSLFQYRAFIFPTSQFSVHRETMRRYPGHDGEAARVRPQATSARTRGSGDTCCSGCATKGRLPTRAFEDRSAVGWQTGGWNDDGRNTSMMLEVLWAKGEVMIAGRAGQERVWDLASRSLPFDEPRPSAGEEARSLLDVQLRALGISEGRAVRVDVRGRSTPGVGARVGAARAGRDGRSSDRRRAAGGAMGARRGPRSIVPRQDRVAVAVRPIDPRSGTLRGALRVPIPARDLRPEGEARVRLLRVPDPPRRPDRRPARPRPRPRRERVAGAERASRRRMRRRRRGLRSGSSSTSSPRGSGRTGSSFPRSRRCGARASEMRSPLRMEPYPSEDATTTGIDAAVQLSSDEGADRDDARPGSPRTIPAGAGAEPDRFGEHGRARRRARAPDGRTRIATGHDRSALRMGGFDDLAGRGVEAPPEAQRLVEHECRTGRAALDEGPSPPSARPVIDSSRTTRPAAADRTHSSRLPRATSIAEVARRVPRPLPGVGHHRAGDLAQDRRDVRARVGHDGDAGVGEVVGDRRRPRRAVRGRCSRRRGRVGVASRPAPRGVRSSVSDACGVPTLTAPISAPTPTERELVPRGAEIGEGDRLLTGASGRDGIRTSAPRA